MIVKQNKTIILLISIFVVSFLIGVSYLAHGEIDLDTDGDGYSDLVEIGAGYSPYNPAPVRFGESDMDGDGLSDYFEYRFGTDPFNSDSDGDGYSDFEEINNAYDPLNPEPVKLETRVEINLSEQTLSFFVADVKFRELVVSTGKASMPTPTGEFKVVNKIPLAWSRTYGLWMPFWIGLDRGGIGIHELPYWPNGYREGSDHLGVPVSHGCIRLAIGAAEYIYNHVSVGDTILIKP